MDRNFICIEYMGYTYIPEGRYAIFMYGSFKSGRGKAVTMYPTFTTIAII